MIRHSITHLFFVLFLWAALPSASVSDSFIPALGGFDPITGGITELQSVYANGVKSQDVVQVYLQRIEKFDRGPKGLNSIVALADDALIIAAALDAERAQSGPRSPLHGVPILIKDNIDVAGLPTSNGYDFLADSIPTEDSFVVQRLRDAGAIILGKTNMPDGARGYDTISTYAGTTRNPYAYDRSAGGSSGGSAVAVAAGFAPVALGTDSIGSIRVPAAYNNVIGLRPTTGLVGRSGTVPGASYRNVIGPIAKNARDIALLMNTISALDPNDPYHELTEGAAKYQPNDFMQTVGSMSSERPLKGLRIGVYSAYLNDPLVTPEVASVFQQVVENMKSLGAIVLPYNETPPSIETPPRRHMVGTFLYETDLYFKALPKSAPVNSVLEFIFDGGTSGHIRGIEAFYFSLLWSAPWLFDPHTEQPSFKHYFERREKVVADFEGSAFSSPGAGFDALIFPTMTAKVPHNGEDNGLLGVVEPSLLGLPVLTVPAGESIEGLPVGFDLLGKCFSEPVLIAIADIYNRVIASGLPLQLGAN